MILYPVTRQSNDLGIDTHNMILSYTEEELKYLIEDLHKKGEEIFFVYEDLYNQLLNQTDIEYIMEQIRKNGIKINALTLLTELNNAVKNNNEKAKKIIKLLNPKELVIHTISENNQYKSFLELCFEILENDSTYNKYLDFENNKELFSLNNHFNQKDYLIQLSYYFGEYDKDINLENDIFKMSFITEDMIKRYLQLRNIINVDLDVFDNINFYRYMHTTNSKKEQNLMDNDWTINQDLLDYIFNDLNPNYTIEEKIAHIYIKLCFILKYNDNFYTDYTYNPNYNRKKQESISPKSPFIICGEFARLCTKIFNNLDSQVEARCIKKIIGEHEFFSILIKDKNIRIDFEATSQTNEGTFFNDLSRAKLGLELLGIKLVADRNHIFENAFNKVYKKLLEDKKIQTEDLISAYEKITNIEKTKNDSKEKIISFLEHMKKNNIEGNELLCSFYHFALSNTFGNIKFSNVICDFTERTERDALILINNEYYILRTLDKELLNISQDTLELMFENGTITYEDSEYTIKGIGGKK